MKKLGDGWQYSVYDMRNNRVSKKFHSPVEAHFIIAKKLFPKHISKFYKIPNYVRGVRIKAENSLSLIKKLAIPQNLIGNPILKDGLDYEQDKIESIKDFLHKNSKQGNKIISNFISLNKKLIRYGVIDKSFNIGDNFGINGKQEIILMDLGELLGGKNIKKQISKRPWIKHYVVNSIPRENRDYFVSEMNKNFL